MIPKRTLSTYIAESRVSIVGPRLNYDLGYVSPIQEDLLGMMGLLH